MDKYPLRTVDNARVNKDAVRKKKSSTPFEFGQDVKKDKKGFFGYRNRKQHQKATTVPLKNRTGELVTGNAEKAEALTSSFSSLCTSTAGPLALGPKIQAAGNTDPAVSVREEWGMSYCRS